MSEQVSHNETMGKGEACLDTRYTDTQKNTRRLKGEYVQRGELNVSMGLEV